MRSTTSRPRVSAGRAVTVAVDASKVMVAVGTPEALRTLVEVCV